MKKTMLRAVLALAGGVLALHGAHAATAQVAVNGGTVTVTPSSLVLPAADKAAVYGLITKGYVIVSVAVPQMTCSVAADGATATCRRAESVKGTLDVALVVRPVRGDNLPSPNIFIQAD